MGCDFTGLKNLNKLRGSGLTHLLGSSLPSQPYHAILPLPRVSFHTCPEDVLVQPANLAKTTTTPGSFLPL